MKRGKLFQAIAASLMLTVASCGYFFHPERRGNMGGDIAGGSLVGDLLWLIPGIVPGVVALVIDFTSGAIYVNGGHYAMTLPPHGTLAIRLPVSDRLIDVDASVVTAKHGMLAHGSSVMGPKGTTLQLEVTEAMRTSAAAGEPMSLELRASNGAKMSTPIALSL